MLTRIFSVGSNFLSKLAPLSFIKSLIFLYFNVLRPHILLISIFLCLFGAPPFFLFFFSFSILTPVLLNLYFTILIISPPFRSVLFCFPFCALWRPFLHLCCCLFTPVYSHYKCFNVLRPHILLISIFLCLFGAPPFFHFFFSFLNFDAPIYLFYILSFLLSHRPSVLYYFASLFVLCGAPSFTFVAVRLRLYIPIFYALTFYAPIFCSSLFSFVYLAPRLSFTFFFLFSILTPLFAYFIFYHSYYLTALPFCIILLSFLCFLAPLPSPLLLFVYAFIFPCLPFWRF